MCCLRRRFMCVCGCLAGSVNPTRFFRSFIIQSFLVVVSRCLEIKEVCTGFQVYRRVYRGGSQPVTRLPADWLAVYVLRISSCLFFLGSGEEGGRGGGGGIGKEAHMTCRFCCVKANKAIFCSHSVSRFANHLSRNGTVTDEHHPCVLFRHRFVVSSSSRVLEVREG